MESNLAYVSIYPNGSKALISREAFFFNMYKSLTYLKDIAIRTTNYKKFSTENILMARKDATVLNPRLFFLHDMLLDQMRNNDELEVVSTLEHIEKLCNEEKSKYSVPCIKSVGNEDWEQFIIKSSIQSVSEFGRTAKIEPVCSDSLSKQRPLLKPAFEIIDKNLPEMSKEIDIFLHKIRVFKGVGTMGITDVRMFGCMFIREPRSNLDPILYYTEHIIHEVSHMTLNSAMIADQIVLNGREAIFNSPLRTDLRPMLGVFHATFVTARIVLLFSKIAKKTREENVLEYLEQQLDELATGINEIKKGGILTNLGESLLNESIHLMDSVCQEEYWDSYDFTIERKHRFNGDSIFIRQSTVDQFSLGVC